MPSTFSGFDRRDSVLLLTTDAPPNGVDLGPAGMLSYGIRRNRSKDMLHSATNFEMEIRSAHQARDDA
jgi:hypothetical protein